jgi:hypothetical protein
VTGHAPVGSAAAKHQAQQTDNEDLHDTTGRPLETDQEVRQSPGGNSFTYGKTPCTAQRMHPRANSLR